SLNWQNNLIGTQPFSNFTEDNQQFILYGDPELSLINESFDLAHPTSYRPLVHAFYEFTYRKNGETMVGFANIWANITDLDSNIKTGVFAKFSITGTVHGGDPSIQPWQNDVSALLASVPKDDYYNFRGQTKFDDPSLLSREPLGLKTVNWQIYDAENEIELSVPIYLLNNPPIIIIQFLGANLSKMMINDTGVYNYIDHFSHDVLGRVNESLSVSFYVLDSDHNVALQENLEFNVTLALRNINDNSWLNFTMAHQPDADLWDEYSRWNYTYHFNEFDPIGRYIIYCCIVDYDGPAAYPQTSYDSEYQYHQYFNLINWVPEVPGTNYVVTNASGSTHRVFRVNETLEFFGSVFDVDGNQTHVQNVTLCFFKAPNQWINVTLSDTNFDNNWTGMYTFTPYNVSGVWNHYLQAVDKDNATRLFKPNTNITVVDIPPNPPFNLAIKNATQIAVTSVLRNQSVQLFANATDLDIQNRTTDLKLYACLKNPSGVIRYQNVMTYNSSLDEWVCSFTPLPTDAVGNWTYYVSAWDEANVHTNSTQLLTLTVLNNFPIIQSVNILPSGQILNIGETLYISGTVFDVEQLDYIQIFIKDSKGTTINSSHDLTGQSDSYIIAFTEADYGALATTGTWNITMKLVDATGNYTGKFTFNLQEQNTIVIVVRKDSEPNPWDFPFEVLIIVAIVVTVVLATFLVYKTRKKEATVIPAARVKQIIKKISKEKEEDVARTKADIKAKISSIEIKPKAKVETAPAVKAELTEEDKEKLNEKIRELIKEAQEFLEKKQIDEAAANYHEAAKIASKLEKYEIARVYSDKEEEILKNKAEILKKEKAELKQKKKKRKTEEILSQAEIEKIKADIGEIMRSARKAVREEDYISAAKQYREVAALYRKILDEENAVYFEEKADELK
ncbi:MAG TPA: hypothetical protein VMV49_04950, partial [Candidatus Deferrimicrobium sp.]|nr:hypothetical protein [Candidatus Deferrimicrobium sp.]